MKTFIHSLKISVIALFLLTGLLGGIYPLFMWGIGQFFFHTEANGKLFYYENGAVLGSEWIAQNFTSDRYFHPRPSAAGNKGYDAANSSGSNLGPTSAKLIDTLKERAKAYRTFNKLSCDTPIPADAVTSSGSGLDPHIGVENAQIQAGRVAAARNLPQHKIDSLIADYTQEPSLWLFGEKRINVLRINLALDKLSMEESS
jgi:K+-transporting ATPase ATPase C chain